ncbi:MAG: methyltransferase domain-containing protein [Kofleriaceae bacterium]
MTGFVGSIPALYDRHMGPVLFEPYAHQLARRLPPSATRVLEIAAGTGRVTRQLLARLPATAELTVTDLNEPMLVEARRQIGDDPRATWRTTDVQALPFGDAVFEVIVFAFGLMFVPDKARAMRELHRVLGPGGTLILATWDSLDRNPASHVLHDLAMASCPADPPTFMALPFSMGDPEVLRELARAAGFAGGAVETIELASEAVSADDLATGFVRGNPLWNQLVERGVDGAAFQAQVTAALIARFGDRPCRSPISAHVLVAAR